MKLPCSFLVHPLILFSVVPPLLKKDPGPPMSSTPSYTHFHDSSRTRSFSSFVETSSETKRTDVCQVDTDRVESSHISPT